MFDIIGKYEAKGMAEGEVKGKAEGIIMTCEELGWSKDETLVFLARKLNLSLEDAQNVYDKYKEDCD